MPAISRSARDRRAAIDATELLDEAEVEHAVAKDLLAQLRDGDAGDSLYDAPVKVLGETSEGLAVVGLTTPHDTKGSP